MSPRRSSSRTHQLVQRRPRIERACQFCRIAKQRCEPVEYGTNDRACRRCVSQGLDCSIPRTARSQSPSSGSGVHGAEPVRHSIAPLSAGGATEELTQGSETNVQYTQQQFESLQVPMGRYSQFIMRSDGRQGSSTTILSAGQTTLPTPGFLPLAPSIEGYHQSFSNVAQGSTNLESGYYPQDYYGRTTSSDTYMASYATQGTSDGAPDLGYIMDEPQPDNSGAFSNEEDPTLPRSGES